MGKDKKVKKEIKYFIFSKSQSDKDESRSIDEYPTNKYIKLNAKKGYNEDYSSLNYNENLNIFSGSSDVIRSSECSIDNRIDMSKKPKDLYLDSYAIEVEDVNMKEIRFYESHSPMKKKSKISKVKKGIEEEILEEYPELNEE